MGKMVDGAYLTEEDTSRTSASGEWERTPSIIRNWITADGSPGPAGEGGFRAQADRYHLYVAWNCPWAHRALLTRAIKRLDDLITISVASPRRTDQGWVHDEAGEYADSLLGVTALHEVYAREAEPYSGRVTVPVLWDKQRGRIVSNESADIVRMLNSAFCDIAPAAIDLFPTARREAIDGWNDLIYRTVNNGVYRAGFATRQTAYEKAAREVFETLDRIEEHLGKNRYLAGGSLTEADVRLFPTLARFDVAYHYAFKCNLRRLCDYENLWPYAREIFQMPQVRPTVRFDIYKRGYFSPSERRNPLGIVPIGPQIDWDRPHGRG